MGLRLITRIAACLLLLLVAGELYACATGLSTTCELSGTSGKPGDQSATDDCMCCCFHLYIPSPPSLPQSFSLSGTIQLPDSEDLSFAIAALYRPPRA